MQLPDKHKAEKVLRKTVQPWLGHRGYFEVTGDKDSQLETYSGKNQLILFNNLFEFYHAIILMSGRYKFMTYKVQLNT